MAAGDSFEPIGPFDRWIIDANNNLVGAHFGRLGKDFRFDQSDGSSLVGFTQSGTGAVAITVQDALRAGFVSTKHFGGLSASNTAAANASVLQTAINALGTNGLPTVLYVQDGSFAFGTNITISSTCTVIFGNGTYTLSNCNLLIGGEKSITVLGQSAKQTTITGNTAGQTLIQFAGLNSGSGSRGIRTTILSRLCLDGASTCGYGVVIPDNSGSFTMSNGRTYCQDVEFSNFVTAGYKAGASAFFQYLDRCIFDFNAIGIDNGRQSDMTVFGCVFGIHTVAGIKTAGAQQRYIANSFTMQTTSDVPDIWMTDTQSYGTIEVGPGNYFGNEGTNTGRYNIRIASSDGLQMASDIRIIDNWFYGETGQKCIHLNTPVDAPVITGNHFRGYDALVDDTTSQPQGMVGGGVFTDNVVSNYNAATTLVFTNGGRGFGTVGYPQRSGGINVPDATLLNKQNRFRWSEDRVTITDSYSWVKSTGVTATDGQTDSKGGTKACLVSIDGTSAAQALQAKLDVTSLLTDTGAVASGQTGRVVVKFGAKAGTLAYAVVACRDTTDGRIFAKRFISLSSVWKNYTFTFTGIDPSHNTNILIYPGSDSVLDSGTMYVEFPSASDFGSEYVPTFGTLVSTTAAQTRELIYSASLTPASVAAATAAEQTFTVTGLQVGDIVTLNGPAPTAGTGVGGVRVSAINTLAINFFNCTAGALTPASGTYQLSVSRQ
jgi:hypothetical protein